MTFIDSASAPVGGRTRSRDRTRARVLQVAQRHIAAGTTELPLNAVAREAGVGVGTVYRHFPTPQSLLEAASLASFTALVEQARSAAAEADPAVGLRSLLGSALRRQLDDAAFACILAASAPGPEVAALGAELGRIADDLLARAHRAGTVRPELDAAGLQRLFCGLYHAVTAGQRTAGDLELFLDVVMSGLAPAAT